MNYNKLMDQMMTKMLRERVEQQGQALGLTPPSAMKPISLAKGVVTGLSLTAAMGFGVSATYLVSSMLAGIIPWEKIAHPVTKTLTKGGIIGLSATAGGTVTNYFIEVGDDFNDLIDIIATQVYVKQVEEAMPEAEDEEEE